jgi:hypothetical protein
MAQGNNGGGDALSHWKKYGLAMVVLYIAAGQDASQNRFEIEADLRKGGYK